MDLFQFQQEAAAQITDRFIAYFDDPAQTGTAKHPRTVPFFQALAALTGAGKTLILAEAVSQIAATMPIPPVVLWLSRGKAVVRQSFSNLSPGGKYHQILDNVTVLTLADYTPVMASTTKSALLCFATVGTFNQKDKEAGTLTIFQSDIDATETSTWNALKLRLDGDGVRRPLLVVYDEGHNFSDQQTELLMELEPDGFLLASATMHLPARLNQEVESLKRAGWTEDQLITKVLTADVVTEGLVKRTVDLAGYNAPMEDTIASLLKAMKLATEDASAQSPAFTPKAIYVCNTNTVADNAHLTDDPKQPFGLRQAPPILIWRYLVEQCDIDPSEIAVYANLRTHKAAPLPAEFILYGGADDDFDRFSQGEYRHIIFNLTLQEGWDDPEVYFAYIDKSMESTVQVTQVIGRVLRQPHATHYEPDHLNTASFFVRVDQNGVFDGVVTDVDKQLGGELNGIKIVSTPPGKPKPISYPPKFAQSVPMTGLDGVQAQAPIEVLMNEFPDFRADTTNTVGVGSRKLFRQAIGEEGTAGEWERVERSSRVSARWVFHREVQRRYRQALNVVNLANPKLDAAVGVGSPAFSQVVNLAEKVVQRYVGEVRVVQRGPNPYRVQSISARPEDVVKFNNAEHEGYAGLNLTLELPFAEALDKTGAKWARNPPRVGFGIDLVTVGATQRFYPDFLVWTGTRVVCVDTKGGHLVREAAGRKLLNIKKKSLIGPALDVQFVSRGKLNAGLEQEGPDGFTLWGLSDEGKLKASHFGSLDPLLAALLNDDNAG